VKNEEYQVERKRREKWVRYRWSRDGRRMAHMHIHWTTIASRHSITGMSPPLNAAQVRDEVLAELHPDRNASQKVSVVPIEDEKVEVVEYVLALLHWLARATAAHADARLGRIQDERLLGIPDADRSCAGTQLVSSQFLIECEDVRIEVRNVSEAGAVFGECKKGEMERTAEHRFNLEGTNPIRKVDAADLPRNDKGTVLWNARAVGQVADRKKIGE
jgi:hypothetical protein